MTLIIKIVFLVVAVLGFLSSFGAKEQKQACIDLTTATIASVLLLVGMKIF